METEPEDKNTVTARIFDILPALKSGVSRLSEDDISVSIHPRNKQSLLLCSKLRGVLEICYKDGKDTGRTEVLDLTDPEVAKKLQESLQKQDGEFD